MVFHLGENKEDLGALGTIISGGIAGVTLWTVIFPADVIKSRQQVQFDFFHNETYELITKPMIILL